MRIIDVTFENPLKNIEYDEELLNFAQKNNEEVIRFWEPKSYFVSLGISSNEDSIYKDICENDNIPVIKRNSGGEAVLLGPGCLNYSFILTYNKELLDIHKSYVYILNKICFILKMLGRNNIEIKGISDIAMDNKKISGNAQIRKKKFLLLHGTLLYNFNIDLIPKYLKEPEKQPDYRKNRLHKDFLTNINLFDPEFLKQELHGNFSD